MTFAVTPLVLTPFVPFQEKHGCLSQSAQGDSTATILQEVHSIKITCACAPRSVSLYLPLSLPLPPTRRKAWMSGSCLSASYRGKTHDQGVAVCCFPEAGFHNPADRTSCRRLWFSDAKSLHKVLRMPVSTLKCKSTIMSQALSICVFKHNVFPNKRRQHQAQNHLWLEGSSTGFMFNRSQIPI